MIAVVVELSVSMAAVEETVSAGTVTAGTVAAGSVVAVLVVIVVINAAPSLVYDNLVSITMILTNSSAMYGE